MEMDKGLRILGLGYRSRGVQIGSVNIEQKIKKRQGFLLLLAADCGDSTQRKLIDLCEKNKIPWQKWGSREEFSRIFPRETVAVLILDANIAKPFLNGKGRVLND